MRGREVSVADLVVKTVLIKLQAMDALDRGLLSGTGVTTVDRLAVILGSVTPRYRRRLLSTAPTDEDIEAVLRMGEGRVHLYEAELVALASLRRLAAELEKKGVDRVCEILAYDGEAEEPERIRVS